jgi:nicotinamide riboside transporter PnuC
MGYLEKTTHFCNKMGIFSVCAVVGIGCIAYTATHLYVWFCAPKGIWGFIASLIVMDSTFCQMILGIIHHSHKLYGAMLVALFFSLIALINKGVAWLSSTTEAEIPTVIHSRPISRSMTSYQSEKKD